MQKTSFLQQIIGKAISLILIGSLSGLYGLICCVTICAQVSTHSCSDQSDQQYSTNNNDAGLLSTLFQSKADATGKAFSPAAQTSSCSTGSTGKSSCCKSAGEASCSTKKPARVTSTPAQDPAQDHCAKKTTPTQHNVDNRVKTEPSNKLRAIKSVKTSSVKTFAQIATELQPAISVAVMRTKSDCSSLAGCCMPLEDDAELPVLPQVNNFQLLAADLPATLQILDTDVTIPTHTLSKPPRLINNEDRYLRRCVFLI